MESYKVEGASPAPWKVELGERDGMDIVRCVKDANGDRVVETDSGYYPPKFADAYIIAAAPSIYACLKEATAIVCGRCDKDCDEGCEGCFVLDWKAAICAAEGRPIHA